MCVCDRGRGGGGGRETPLSFMGLLTGKVCVCVGGGGGGEGVAEANMATCPAEECTLE